MKQDELFALLRRRGFLWPSAEIYGGAQGLYDYGPLGTALKRRIEEAWTAWYVGLSEDHHLIEASEILPEAVVRASGHLENFTDPEVTCGSCGHTFRADTALEAVRPEGVDGLSPEAIGTLLVEAKARCPKCGSDKLSVPRPFHLMFGLEFGAKGEERAYLRPETAQSSFLAFDRMFEVGRKALPLGLAVIGKAYRNEIAPRQLLFRMRSFTQAELEVFFDPSEPGTSFDRVADVELPVLRVERRGALGETPEPISARELTTSGGLPEFYVYYLAETYRFFRGVLGYPADAIRFWEKSDRERAFYNRLQFDVEVRIDSLGGFKELGAVHYRGDYDLARHSKGSGKDLAVTTAAGRRVLPHILEVTFGVDRNLWALADAGLRSDGERTVFHLPPYLAPVSVAVLPLLKKPHAEAARAIARRLREEGLRVAYDEAGAIGRRYARMDEAGVPFCLTVDGETVGSTPGALGSVTVRDRDSKGQERLSVEAAAERVHREVRLPRPEPLP